MQYRRANITGGTYFFTVNLADRKKTLLVDEFELLRDVINKVKKQHPFILDAMVVLPEHLHAMLTLPTNDKDFSTRWMLIKSGFSRHVDYIHYNPVKHGYVKMAADWPYSTVHRYIKNNLLDRNWGCGNGDNGIDYGEAS